MIFASYLNNNKMTIQFKKSDPEFSIVHNDDRQVITMDLLNSDGYGVYALISYDLHSGRPSGDGVTTPIERDVTPYGIGFDELILCKYDEDENEVALTDEEKASMIKEVLDWAKSELS